MRHHRSALWDRPLPSPAGIARNAHYASAAAGADELRTQLLLLLGFGFQFIGDFVERPSCLVGDARRGEIPAVCRELTKVLGRPVHARPMLMHVYSNRAFRSRSGERPLMRDAQGTT